MPHILIAFDGSPSARVAVARAAELFPGADATIVSVCHGLGALADAAAGARAALPDEVIRKAVAGMRAQALDEARELAEDGSGEAAAAGLRASSRVVEADGALWAALVDAADELGADVIVCGTRGHGAATRAVLGSVAAGLVHHARRPVLAVPDAAANASGPVLVAFDGSDPALAATAAAGRLFAGREGLVLHVWRSPVRHTLTGAALRNAPLDDVRDIVSDLDVEFADWAQGIADAGVRAAGEHGLEAHARAEESRESAAHVVMAVADEVDAAVVVVGPRGRGAVARAVLGSVTAGLLHAADRPVLVAHG